MMNTLLRTALAVAAISATTASFAANIYTDKNTLLRPSGTGVGIIENRPEVISQTVTCTSGICYHGGPLMVSQTKVFFIWYGNWTAHAAGKTALADMITNLNGSPIYNINTTYTNNAGTHVINSVVLAKQIHDNLSQGTALTNATVQAIVTGAIAAGKLPKRSDALYFVLTAPNVTLSGFGTQFCGWHTYTIYDTTKIKYSFVGNASTQAPSGCGASGLTPNDDAGIDGMASVVFHELSETVTDPLLNAWYDNSGMENADKCAWTFGTLYTAPNGALANVHLGSRDYKLQRNWVHDAAGYCSLSF